MFYLISLILFLLGIIILIARFIHNRFGMSWALTIWNIVAMLPILCSPIVFFGSCFIFDNPSSLVGAIFLFIAMNSYSVLLMLGCICSGKCWRKGKLIYAWAIPTISIVIVYGFILTMFLYEHTV